MSARCNPPALGAPALLTALLLSLAGCGTGFVGDLEALGDHPNIHADDVAQAEPEHLPVISGGTLAVSAGGRAVVAAPDHGVVQVADVLTGEVRGVIAAGGEPGRVVIDRAGRRAYVALRRAGAILVVDARQGHALGRLPTCSAPRGLALTDDDTRLHVACAGGHLMSHDTATGEVVRRVAVAPDLRDVVASGGRLAVSRFRAAELLWLDAEGRVEQVSRPPVEQIQARRPGVPPAVDPDEPGFDAAVAWRTITAPDGTVFMLHQVAWQQSFDPTRWSSFGSNHLRCFNGAVTTAVSRFAPDGTPGPMITVKDVVLGVDLAVDRERIVVVAPGRRRGRNLRRYVVSVPRDFDEVCAGDGADWPVVPFSAVALTPRVGLVLFRFERPALLDGHGRALVELWGRRRPDVGREEFHTDRGAGIACASCHPEGSEDGIAWRLSGIGPRRTIDLRGGIEDGNRYNRDLSQDTLHDVNRSLQSSMGGSSHFLERDALGAWLHRVPTPMVDPIGDGDPLEGARVFNDPVVGCADCHHGGRLSDGERHDLGRAAQVKTAPLLAVGRRERLMYDGCGADLSAIFDPDCAGPAHGRTDHLDEAQRGDLLAYLRTL